MDADARDADGQGRRHGGRRRRTRAARRARMVEHQLVGRGMRDPDVLAAMRAVPRHLFVPDELRHAAYDDSPLPIGFGQTISQPYMVACMTELLARERPQPSARRRRRVRLSDGGARRAGRRGLRRRAARRPRGAGTRALATLGYDNIVVTLGDGSLGWPEHAPFDGIIVAAAAPQAPPPLLDQLAEGGRLVSRSATPIATRC